ncbi:hypothetical protein TWF679_009615 [Orbilia oligospora]|uniref:Uncharacterized protein n=1 Tax=Orbilia oligospora TaxID=2813651 RepID=A0A8H8VJ76_ORBOL|nr:hypothetical protein TWF679_009615 [Orbilia oligospora]
MKDESGGDDDDDDEDGDEDVDGRRWEAMGSDGVGWRKREWKRVVNEGDPTGNGNCCYKLQWHHASQLTL